jgi:hypothetical protein
MCDFTAARIGDNVWEYPTGWTKIDDTDHCDIYPIKTVRGTTYTINGFHRERDIMPSLFWDEIRFEIPPRPKRKVKKVLHGWVNIYLGWEIMGLFYLSKESADNAASPNRMACIEINQEYETEE